MTPIGIALAILLGLNLYQLSQTRKLNGKLKELAMATKATDDQAIERLDSIDATLTKVSGETAQLIQEIEDLKNTAQTEGVSERVMAKINSVADRATSIDDQVADPTAPSSSEVTAV